MSNPDESMVLDHIVSDTRYHDMSVPQCKLRRAHMINSGTATKYELACVQYWIMHKEGRLPWNK